MNGLPLSEAELTHSQKQGTYAGWEGGDGGGAPSVGKAFQLQHTYYDDARGTERCPLGDWVFHRGKDLSSHVLFKNARVQRVDFKVAVTVVSLFCAALWQGFCIHSVKFKFPVTGNPLPLM